MQLVLVKYVQALQRENVNPINQLVPRWLKSKLPKDLGCRVGFDNGQDMSQKNLQYSLEILEDGGGFKIAANGPIEKLGEVPRCMKERLVGHLKCGMEYWFSLKERQKSLYNWFRNPAAFAILDSGVSMWFRLVDIAIATIGLT
ncbi:hypothetical protein C8F04DRAFT_1186601 [Mycena alexandri]|uniref:Uncharacterized protein n=1 Tax=Mycena alexandri TaxID=1745969 RepID=A0AAD6X0X2_9AGAR|nr:hypothetical protein C8F04DRAFT_1186601 [Mycena alexandri]